MANGETFISDKMCFGMSSLENRDKMCFGMSSLENRRKMFSIIFIRDLIHNNIQCPELLAVCCGVRGRALASHTDVRGFEPQCVGRLSSLTC